MLYILKNKSDVGIFYVLCGEMKKSEISKYKKSQHKPENCEILNFETDKEYNQKIIELKTERDSNKNNVKSDSWIIIQSKNDYDKRKFNWVK